MKLNTCHDIRKLTTCAMCGRPDSTDDMAKVVVTHKGEKVTTYWHGRCRIGGFGIKGILDLPREEQDKLTLGDIGVEAMKALMNDRADGGKQTDG